MTNRLVLTRETRDWREEWRAATRIYFDRALGHIAVEHDGSISWDELQAIKDRIAGSSAVAIEVYPPQARVVNNIHMRHLWLLGKDDWWPDLTREGKPKQTQLRDRYLAAQLADGGHI